MMPTSAPGVITLYAAALASMVVAVQLRAEVIEPIRPLERAEARGFVEAGLPQLDPDDPMANSIMITRALAQAGDPLLDPRDCRAKMRWFQVLLEGKPSRVEFSTRAVCQLLRLKEISAAQPGFDHRGLAEMAAFILGSRHGRHVTVTRVVVPPFHFTRDTITFMPADLGPLLPGERFIGTYHTHPDRDVDDGVPSPIDLSFMQRGHVDFHGRVGALFSRSDDIDWLFDIVEARDGEWNVYAHDRVRLEKLAQLCQREASCPLEELRLAGSPYYLLTRYYGEPTE
jgi:hypothetical protein